MSQPPSPIAIDPGVRIGHVHLKVADIDRALAFYRDVLALRSRSGTAAARSSSQPAAITITSA